jgi:hypothetical protein
MRHRRFRPAAPQRSASLVSPASCSGRTTARAGEADTAVVGCPPCRPRTLGVCSRSLMHSHDGSYHCDSAPALRKHGASTLSRAGKTRHLCKEPGVVLSSLRYLLTVFVFDNRLCTAHGSLLSTIPSVTWGFAIARTSVPTSCLPLCTRALIVIPRWKWTRLVYACEDKT